MANLLTEIWRRAFFEVERNQVGFPEERQLALNSEPDSEGGKRGKRNRVGKSGNCTRTNTQEKQRSELLFGIVGLYMVHSAGLIEVLKSKQVTTHKQAQNACLELCAVDKQN